MTAEQLLRDVIGRLSRLEERSRQNEQRLVRLKEKLDRLSNGDAQPVSKSGAVDAEATCALDGNPEAPRTVADFILESLTATRAVHPRSTVGGLRTAMCLNHDVVGRDFDDGLLELARAGKVKLSGPPEGERFDRTDAVHGDDGEWKAYVSLP